MSHAVLPFSVLEHDRDFWSRTSEVQRELRPSGYFVDGFPICMTLPDGAQDTTRAYARSGLACNADYFRSNSYVITAGRK